MNFSADSTTIVFSNVEPAGLLHLKNVPDSTGLLNEMVSVLRIPSDTDTTSMETPISGKLSISGSNIIFIPARPFVKGQHYLVISHLNARFGGIEKAIKGQIGYNIKPGQKELVR